MVEKGFDLSAVPLEVESNLVDLEGSNRFGFDFDVY